MAIETFTPFSIMDYFTVYSEIKLADPVWYFRLFSHVLGHGNWEHFFGNFALILLVGPILEEKYGSRDVLLMIVLTALTTGLLHVLFFANAGLLGASGIAFMMILLASFTNAKGGIPLTFILVVILYLGREIMAIFAEDNISQFAHIIGGVLGGAFGFLLEGNNRRKAQKKQTPDKTNATS
ncbi:MAG: rhomboid family intramembrane serine protease [Bacteroidota bacterium]